MSSGISGEAVQKNKMAALGALAVHHQSPEEKLTKIQNERMNDIRKLGQAIENQGGFATNKTSPNTTTPILPIPPPKSKSPRVIKYFQSIFFFD